ncbi:uncharacterized protein LOC124253928 [Haliotis rubra]|uniref:uncharacterized protein LOC124253928 n=1 Tax=Haliotis rubra TaxID=36100 RepID=UPI001EE5C5B6|nr:uncharacterized protein LOC124253928 [Haliotis rubra]
MVISAFVVVIFVNHVTKKDHVSVQRDLSMRELKQLIKEQIQAEERYLSQDGQKPSSQNVVNIQTDIVRRKKSKEKRKTTKENNTGPKKHDSSTDIITSQRLRGSKKRYIVHLCDSSRACAGWGDRQRGVVAAYLLAIVTNRVFVLNMTSPCPVRNFLQPHKYDWEIPDSELVGKSAITVGGVRATDYHKVARFQDFNKVYDYDVIYLRSNSDLLNIIKSNPLYKNRIPNWAKTYRHRAFKNGWEKLMTPTNHMTKQINVLLKGVDLQKQGDLVCAHVRIGKNAQLPNDSPNRNSIESVDALWEFLDPYVKNATRIFIATDSMEVRELARKRFGKKTLDSGGTIIHIDRQRKSGSACDGFETAILEQLILTKCHVLVVSASNFSIRGAFLRGTNDKLFMFRNATVKPFNMGT